MGMDEITFIGGIPYLRVTQNGQYGMMTANGR